MSEKRAKLSSTQKGQLTPAQIQWLTGEPQDNVNPFEFNELAYPWHKSYADRCLALLEQYPEYWDRHAEFLAYFLIEEAGRAEFADAEEAAKSA